MDPQSSYHDLPWELIVQALQGELSPDEDVRFREWLALSESNRSEYLRLQELWKEGMGDYAFYRSADEVAAWDALRSRMEEGVDGAAENVGEEDRRETAGTSGRLENRAGKRVISIGRWAAVAAVLLVVAGAGWWYMAGKGSATGYETAAGEQKTISLPDGTTVSLNAQTRIQLDGDYNNGTRKVLLVSGSAAFKVLHQAQQPFIVDMGIVSVRDIGTSFTIERTKDNIHVMVSEGKIAFTETGTGQVREMSAGDSISYSIADRRAGDLIKTRFDNAPLSEVITTLEKLSGRKIVLSDPAIAQKRLTVHLAGESFEDALKTVCASLDLEYTPAGGAYLLKSRDTSTHN